MIVKKILKKNIIFKDKFHDQECYLFGNGASLKKFDLKNFSDKKSIICGWMFLHKDFKFLNVISDIEMHPAIFFPFWKNPYTKSIEFNYVNYIFKKKERVLKSNYFITSLTNFLGLTKYKNINYVYHYGLKKFNKEFIDPLQKFSLMENSLYAMIGIASFMGFKKIYLVGMDYLLDSPVRGHFYENYETIISPKKNVSDNNKYFFDFFSKKIKFTFISSTNNISSFFDTISYENFFKKKKLNYKNNHILSLDDLKLLDKTNLRYKIF